MACSRHPCGLERHNQLALSGRVLHGKATSHRSAAISSRMSLARVLSCCLVPFSWYSATGLLSQTLRWHLQRGSRQTNQQTMVAFAVVKTIVKRVSYLLASSSSAACQWKRTSLPRRSEARTLTRYPGRAQFLPAPGPGTSTTPYASAWPSVLPSLSTHLL